MWTVILVVVLSPVFGSSRPPSPCPEVYGYEITEHGELKGLIGIMTPPRYPEVELLVVLSSPAAVHEREVGDLSLKGGKKAAEEATRQVVLGRAHLLQFYITFPPGKPIPTVLKITVNDKDFCVNKNPPSDTRAKITLNSFLSTGVNAPPTKDFAIVGSVPIVTVAQESANAQDSVVSVVTVPPETNAVKDDYYLSRMIVKLLRALVEIQQQRLSVEHQILSLGKHKHIADRIHFSDD